MRNLHFFGIVFFGSTYTFFRFSNLSGTLCLDDKYTMAMTKLQHKTDQLALTIVKISNIHSLVFLKIQPCIKTHAHLKKDIHFGLLFCKHNGTFNIIKVNTKWFILANIVEFLRQA